MPMVRLTTNVEIGEAKKTELLSALSKLVAKGIGKPERYVMAIAEGGSIIISGQPGPAAFAEVRSIGGLNAEANGRITSGLCSLLKERLAISPERVYVNFLDIPAGDWGWNGETFG